MTAQEGADAARHALQARVDLALARYPEALVAARAAVTADPRRAGAQGLLAQAQAEVLVRDPSWRPPVPGPSRPHQPRPGHVTMVVANSLPRRQSGYSIRTQNVALALGQAGLDVVVASRRQEDLVDGSLPIEAWEVSGVRYRITSATREIRERPTTTDPSTRAGIAAIEGGPRGRVSTRPAGRPRACRASLRGAGCVLANWLPRGGTSGAEASTNRDGWLTRDVVLGA